MLRLVSIVLLSLFSISSLAQDFIPGRVIVKLKGKASISKNSSFAAKAENEKSLKQLKSWPRFNMHSFEAKTGQSTEQLIQELKADPDVEYVEPDYILNKQNVGESVQAYSYDQVRSFVSGFGLTTNQVQGVEAWAEVTQNNHPIVAVIDTGVDLYHEALSAAIWVNSDEIANNGIDDDGNGFVDDVNGWNFADGNNYPQDCDGHGTHVAGIVRGTTEDLFNRPDPEQPIIQIMAVKFLDCYGSGSTSSAISAIYYAVNNGAKVLNNSWGGGGYSRALEEAIKYSYDNKTVFVAAAGNSANNNDSNRTYPASYSVPNIISVAASTSSDYLASFSNYGFSTVHLASPGSSILSAYLGDQYATMSGTSMAAPFVAGVAALIVNEQPTMNGYQVKSIVMNTVDSAAPLSGKVTTGGRSNHLHAVSNAKTATVNPSQPDYSVGASPEDRALASAMAGGGAGCGLVSMMNDSGKGGSGGGNTPIGGILLISIMILIPVLFAQTLREQKQRRVHQRYSVESTVHVKLGDQEIEADLSTISLGGVGIQTNAVIEKGSEIKLKIKTQDGQLIEAQGRVVWCDQKQSYGVQFMKTNKTLLEAIQTWTSVLMPA